jgi:hypothetical protein
MIQDTMKLARERVKAIRWVWDGDSKAGSSMLLLEEFLRRAALWAEVLGIIDLPGTGWPLIDYSTYIDSSLKIDEDNDDFDELSAQAEELLVEGSPSYYAKKVCVYFVHWAMIKDRPEVTIHNLPDPYEPLIVLYERGCNFRRDHTGVWEYHNTSGFPVRSASYHLSFDPIIELNQISLNRADEEFLTWREANTSSSGRLG